MLETSPTELKRLFNYFWKERYALLIIIGFFTIACFLVSPLRDVPVNDDWTYAWSVEHLLHTGSLHVLDWSAHYPIFQILWGGIWAFFFGFSFGVLRLATVVIAVFGCIALYLTLLELAVARSHCLVGTLLLAANPIYFVLSFTFMTDVYFLSLMNGAVLCYVAGIKRERQALLWIGGLFATSAFLSRQIGIVIPLCLLPCLLSKQGNWKSFLKRCLPLLVSVGSIAVLWYWLVKDLGRTSVMEQKLQSLEFFTSFGVIQYCDTNLSLFFQVSFSLFPLVLVGVSRKPRWLPGAILFCMISSAGILWWRFGEVPLPLAEGMTWSLKELADVRGLIQGSLGAGVTGPVHWAALLSRLLMLLAASVFLVNLARNLLESREKISREANIMLLSGLLQLGIINALWLYYDRYYLVLFPSLIYLWLKSAPASQLSRLLTIIGIGLLAFISITGTWDVLRFNQACVEAINDLRARGVAIAEIDSGYSLSGWMLYSHPENLSPGEIPAEDVAWITTKKALPYVISNAPLPDYEVLRVISWQGPFWVVSNQIYILHRLEPLINQDR